MNVENILKVADAIEQHSIPDLGFNMGDFFSRKRRDRSEHHCGTTACIAGWTYVLQGGNRTWHFGAYEQSRDWLGISHADSLRLFTPENMNWSRITPAQAVRTLRHLAATGEVNWNLPEPA